MQGYSICRQAHVHFAPSFAPLIWGTVCNIPYLHMECYDWLWCCATLLVWTCIFEWGCQPLMCKQLTYPPMGWISEANSFWKLHRKQATLMAFWTWFLTWEMGGNGSFVGWSYLKWKHFCRFHKQMVLARNILNLQWVNRTGRSWRRYRWLSFGSVPPPGNESSCRDWMWDWMWDQTSTCINVYQCSVTVYTWSGKCQCFFPVVFSPFTAQWTLRVHGGRVKWSQISLK